MKPVIGAGAQFRLSLPLLMEIAMRHPLYMDRLDPKDRTMVKRMYVGILVFYSSVFLLVGGAVALYAPHSATAERELAAVAPQMDRLTGLVGRR